MIFEKVLYGSVTVLNLITGIAILILCLLVARTISLSLRRFLKEKVMREHLEILVKLVYYTIIVLAFLTALPMLGFHLSGLLVAGGVIGLAVGFASQNIVGNMISGMFLIIERPIKIGNAVNIDGITGIVEDIQIMSTTLRGFDGLYIRLPNQQVFTAKITNFVSNVARRVDYDIGIRYSDDADKAIAIIKVFLDAQPMVLKNPEPLVFVNELGDSAVIIAIRFWAPVTEWFGVKTQLLWKIKIALENEGIEIPFPQRVVWFANELTKREIPASSSRKTRKSKQ